MTSPWKSALLSGARRMGSWNRDPNPRLLDDGDVDSFFAAAEARRPQLTREQIIAKIEARNPHRWWRIQYDYKWLCKQMKRMGLNPDDARELL